MMAADQLTALCRIPVDGRCAPPGPLSAVRPAYLPKALIRRAKYASIDAGQSLSRLVEDALTAHLGRMEQEGQVSR
jgi:hypothetical protein